jgi:NADPH:quinone reductase-like Zn-dependent oxidoreductase
MKAAVYYKYGPPNVIQISDVEKPVPNDDEVLVKVRAASANPLDWRVMRGTPYIIRIMTGLRKPKDIRLGVDLAGQVEAVGKNITKFQPGDDVFGASDGAFAEYVCAPEKELALKPANLTFEQAAALTVGRLPRCRAFAITERSGRGRKS